MSKSEEEFLGRLELTESELLTWGFVDGAFTYDELVRLAADHQALNEPAEVVENLIDRKALVEVAGPGDRYRTRMAETVRLLSRLRQLLPRHGDGDGWRMASTLVSDYRLTIRRRRYPKRDIAGPDVLAHVAAATELNPAEAAILEALLGRPDRPSWSRFQRDATATILTYLHRTQAGGAVISAGTGSGKTLAFYLPALTYLAGAIDGNRWTRAMALYPRNELLKDQFTEIFSETRSVQSSVRGGRGIVVGAYYGDTPYSAGRWAFKPWDRRRMSDEQWGFVCPYLRCPVQGCSGSMLWPEADRGRSIERLVCEHSRCGGSAEPEQVALTRDSIAKRPPDLLVTTTEMLNRLLSDSFNGHIVGVGTPANRTPRLVLLDEIHTYEGTSGAQNALTLRRWRTAAQAWKAVYVGLSATIRNPRTFFSRLTGLGEHEISHIEPTSDDLTAEGMEYLIALRGDPVAQASLLSTTIQSAMLMRRMLDSPSLASSGLYGTRMFLFADRLDLANRLYWDILDSEGKDSFNRDSDRALGPLAPLRLPQSLGSLPAPEDPERYRAGQVWNVPIDIGHDLRHRLWIERTSSQDAGVDNRADIVVATASLDVGFDDPTVGAVLQHKAPRNSAQFIQRRGRAGRPRGMRPWTVVVLSDYGRDRIAYQGYEALFDPEVDATTLPTGNRYVIRMQAVFAFMDWMSSRMPADLRGAVSMDLAGPAKNGFVERRQRLQAEIILQVLAQPHTRKQLGEYIMMALDLEEHQLDAVMWEPPRALMTAVLPTLLRRLTSGWSTVERGPGSDYMVPRHALPDFVPANLFSDLLIPEVRIDLPPATGRDEPTVESLGILQTLAEFVPGRASRRYSIQHRGVRHWIPVEPDVDGSVNSQILIEDICDPAQGDAEVLGEFAYLDEKGVLATTTCYRPWRLGPTKIPPAIADTSNAFPTWQTQFVPETTGTTLPIPGPSKWSEVLSDVRFFSQTHYSGVEVRRFTTGARVDLAYRSGDTQTFAVSYATQDGAPAAMGVVLDVDGFRITVRSTEHLPLLERDPERLATFRTEFFEHLIRHETIPGDGDDLNVFIRGWVAQAYVSAIVSTSLERNETLSEASQYLLDVNPGRITEVLDTVFQTLEVDELQDVGHRNTDHVSDRDAHDDSGDEMPRRQRLHDRLRDILAEDRIRAFLHSQASCLWQPLDTTAEAWARERFESTLGAAVVEACQRLAHDIQVADLLVDTVPLEDGNTHIWITEAVVGGTGAVEQIFRIYASDPRRFFRIVTSALGPSDFEVVDAELTAILQAATEPGNPVREAIADVRGAYEGDHEEMASTFRSLMTQLRESGVNLSHPVVASLNVRVLRPGSTEATDTLLHELIGAWRDTDASAGLETDARVFARHVAEYPDQILSEAAASELERLAGSQQQADRRYSVLYSLLWPRGGVVRRLSLMNSNRFRQAAPSDRLLVLDQVEEFREQIDVADSNWHASVSRALIDNGMSEITGTSTQLAEAITILSTTPVEAGYLHLNPHVTAIRTHRGRQFIELDLRDAPQ